jgi:hypothetical protein
MVRRTRRQGGANLEAAIRIVWRTQRGSSFHLYREVGWRDIRTDQDGRGPVEEPRQL